MPCSFDPGMHRMHSRVQRRWHWGHSSHGEWEKPSFDATSGLGGSGSIRTVSQCAWNSKPNELQFKSDEKSTFNSFLIDGNSCNMQSFLEPGLIPIPTLHPLIGVPLLKDYSFPLVSQQHHWNRRLYPNQTNVVFHTDSVEAQGPNHSPHPMALLPPIHHPFPETV